MSTAIKAGEAYVELGIRSTLDKGLKAARAKLRNFSRTTTAIGAAITGGVVGALAGPVKLASEMEETMSKFNVVFGESAKEMQAWSDTTAKALGTSKVEMAGMVSGMQDLLVPMGVADETAQGMSKTLSGLAVDLGSFNNMKTSKTFEDLMAAMTGSGEVMKKYGVILNETAVKAELLNMNMDPKTANDAAKAQARLNIIMRSTTAAQGDAVRTAGGFANQLKRLWSNLKDTGVVLGQTVLPPLTKMLTVVNRLATRVLDWANANQWAVQWLGKGLLIFGAVGAGLTAIGTAAGVASFALGGIATAIGAIGTVAAAVFSPVGLAIAAVAAAAIAAAGAIGFLLYKSGMLGDGFKKLQKIVLSVWGIIKDATGGIYDAIQAGDWDLAMQIALKAVEAVAWEGLSQIWDAFKKMIPRIWKMLADFTKRLAKWAAAVARSMKDPAKAAALLGMQLRSMTTFGISGRDTVGSTLRTNAREAREELDVLRTRAGLRNMIRNATTPAAGSQAVPKGPVPVTITGDAGNAIMETAKNTKTPVAVLG